jgi:membrane protein
MIAGVLKNIHAVRGGIGILIIAGAVWGGISFFNAVILSLNVAWGNNRPLPILKTQLLNLALLAAAGLLVLLSVLLTISLNGGNDFDMDNAICQFIGDNVPLAISSNVLVTIFAFLLFILFYKYVPANRPSWKDIWPGALVAALFFEATKFLFIFYLGVFNPFSFLEQSMSIAIAFMMWTYLSVVVFLLVAKVTYVRLRVRNTVI